MEEKIDLDSILVDYENMLKEKDPKVKARLRFSVSGKIKDIVTKTRDPEQFEKIMDQLREKMAAIKNSNEEYAEAKPNDLLYKQAYEKNTHSKAINRIVFQYFAIKSEAHPTKAQLAVFSKTLDEELSKISDPQERKKFMAQLAESIDEIYQPQEQGAQGSKSEDIFDKIHEQLVQDGIVQPDGQPSGSGAGQMGEE